MKKISLYTLFFIFLSCRDTKETSTIEKDIIPNDFNSYSNFEKKKYLDSIFNKLIFSSDDSSKIKNLFEICNQYYFQEDYISSLKTSKEAFNTASKLKDSLNIGRSLYYIGDCYLNYQKDSAYYYYKESEKIFRKLNNKDKLALVLYNKAYLLFYEGNYVESEIEVIKALNCLKSTEKFITKYRCYSLQGSNHLELGEYNKALEYFNLSASILKQMKKENLDKDAFYDYDITNTIDLCTAYDKKEEYSKSIKLLKEVINKGNFTNYPKLYYSVLGNLAYSLMKNNQYEESRKYFVESIKLANNKNDNLGYLYKIIDFGEYHLLTKDTLKARELFNEALQLSKKLNNGKEILKTLDFLSVADKTNASNYKTEYIRINDSIVKKQRENREKFARIEYETDKVEEENKILSNKNLLLLSGLSLSIAVFSIILIIRYRISRKKELYLIQQKELADEELFNLTKEFQTSLVDAKEAEQKKLSKELHDGIVNQIYGIRMMLGSLNANSDEASISQRLFYIKELHKLESEVRDLSHNLNTDFSKYVGEFNFLLEQLIQSNNTIGKTHFKAEIASEIDWSMYSSVIKINIYRILQELLQNVNKYADAKECLVQIYGLNNEPIIKVKDDGVGFDVNSLSKGLGLKNIKERAKSIDSEIEIKSNPNEGTTIKLKVKIGSL
ncbi:tetratricopeptide repeat-containing sensor histidine kinase [uncultured Flavobacterium sp.]|uniref:tetratricopeptide repeat-containing sensor histidine kinase n=1 Tax=uncultured Flavobacterium sp. TaxID=165435 RepID=UPI002593E207|nr:tetratricopeptide repeat-containing sensor histidine kinase [uncultured Flavobacterium sp.]